MVVTNNELSTFVSVLSGGLNVLFLQGKNSTFDYRFLGRSIMQSTAIQMDGIIIRDKTEIDDSLFAPGKYNVFVLSDLPADYLTPKQHSLLVDAVQKGARAHHARRPPSFGAGGWADTPIDGHPPRPDPPRRRPDRARGRPQVRTQHQWV